MDENRDNNLPQNDTAQAEAAEVKHGVLEMHESEDKSREKRDKALKEIKEWVVSLVVALAVVLLIRTFLFTIIRVDGPSMSDTLLNGDRLFVTVLDVKLHGPDRFDVVILHYPNRTENFVKRVIGIPGDTIEIADGVLTINGVEYDESYLSPERTVRFKNLNMSVTLGDDEYFVMGDNRDNSNDSRNVGTISRDMFVGKVRQIIFPFSRWEGVPGSEVYNTQG